MTVTSSPLSPVTSSVSSCSSSSSLCLSPSASLSREGASPPSASSFLPLLLSASLPLVESFPASHLPSSLVLRWLCTASSGFLLHRFRLVLLLYTITFTSNPFFISAQINVHNKTSLAKETLAARVQGACPCSTRHNLQKRDTNPGPLFPAHQTGTGQQHTRATIK